MEYVFTRILVLKIGLSGCICVWLGLHGWLVPPRVQLQDRKGNVHSGQQLQMYPNCSQSEIKYQISFNECGSHCTLHIAPGHLGYNWEMYNLKFSYRKHNFFLRNYDRRICNIIHTVMTWPPVQLNIDVLPRSNLLLLLPCYCQLGLLLLNSHDTRLLELIKTVFGSVEEIESLSFLMNCHCSLANWPTTQERSRWWPPFAWERARIFVIFTSPPSTCGRTREGTNGLDGERR